MKVKRYIEMIKGVDASIDNVIAILNESGATEGEAVLALMVTRDISMDEAQAQIERAGFYITPRIEPSASRKSAASDSAAKTSRPK